MTRYVIIGAGEAGTRAALALQGQGKVTLIGGENHAPYERPPLSKPNPEGVIRKPIANEGTLGDVTFRPGTIAVAIDRAAKLVHLSNAETLAYDRLLLATGASPRSLTCPGGEHALVLRDFEDAQAIFLRAESAKRAVVVGAGLIGLELAAVLREKGLDVTVVEAGTRAVARALPPVMADMLVQKHRAAGVAFHFDAQVSHISRDAVQLADGERLSADLIVAAIGVTPNTVIAEAAGLRCANGIQVSANLKTDDPNIFAAGDCACVDHPIYGPTRFEAWRLAVEMGTAAAAAMTGTDVEFGALPWFWSDQFELGLQMAGFHNPLNIGVLREADSVTFSFELDQTGRLVAAAGLGPGNAVARDIKLAERMIQSRIRPDPLKLGAAVIPLKTLLRDASAPRGLRG